MNRKTRHDRLCRLAALVLQHQSAAMAEAGKRLEILQKQIDALDAFPADRLFADIALAQRHFAYETWASKRRADLYLQRELRQIEWREEHLKSSRALARMDLLEALRHRPKKP